MKSKKAAIELSMTTIVVVVLSLTLLIMGFVLVRSVMCGAINSTKQINDKMKDEINNLFGSTGGEVQCLGSKGDPVALVPGRTNVIGCIVRPESENTYYFKVTPSTEFTDPKIIDRVEDWLSVETTYVIGPGDEDPKKVIELNIPSDAPNGRLALNIEVRKGSTKDLVWSQRLSYTVTNVGIVRSALC
ncbi:MAG: hypothetical protein WC781_04510 [Candidatus Pacearchaeota archaeon]|jgi:hypothetical protein